jgi:Ala-tRNA(Pro) deacylase
MPALKIKQYLDDNHVKYVMIKHSPAFTAQEVAALAHIPGRSFAKAVVVKLDREMAMVVMPASQRVDFELLKRASGAKLVDLATELEFKNLFPECEPGAMPPFGHLYGMPIYGSNALGKDKEITFNAGSHKELIRMQWADFVRLAKPKLAPIATDELVAAH